MNGLNLNYKLAITLLIILSFIAIASALIYTIEYLEADAIAALITIYGSNSVSITIL